MISNNLFKNKVTYKLFALALNNPQEFICHKILTIILHTSKVNRNFTN